LSDADIYLQDPLWRSEDLAYVNPHVMAFSRILDLDVLFAERMLELPGNKGSERQPMDWSIVLDQLPQYSSFQEIDSTLIDKLNSILSTDLIRYV
jgi:hypothetical protein